MPRCASRPFAFASGMLALAGCDATPDPVAPSEPLAVVAAGARSNSDVFLAPIRVVRTGASPQIVVIPLDTLPWSRFMPPFELHVVKEADSLGGPVTLDGDVVLRLRSIPAGDTATSRLAAGPASTLTLSLNGPEGSALTLWIRGALQPPPTVDITGFPRGHMLTAGSDDTSEVALAGQACHERYPIVELVVDGVAQDVAGDQLCEPFEATQRSAWGLTPITVYARNARGRDLLHVQSYLRSPQWLAPGLSLDSAEYARDATTIEFTQAAMDDGNRSGTPNDLASLLLPVLVAELWGPAMGRFVDETPPQPSCPSLGGVTGYTIDGGTITTAGATSLSASLVAGGIRLSGYSGDVTMPVTVRGIHKYCLRGLPRTQTVTRTGTATADYVQSAATENVYLQNGLLQTSVRPGTVVGNVGTIAVDVDLSGTVLTDAQVAEIHEQIRIAFSEHIRQVQRDVMTSRVNRFVAPFVGRFEPESDALGAEGVSFGLAYAWLEVTTTRLTQGLDLRFAPTERPGGAAPAQGPIVREYLFSVVPPHGGQPATIGVREEAFNALFWSAWQAGSLGMANLVTHPAAPATQGLRLELRPLLPPVLMRGTEAGRVRIAWGDLRLNARVDPSVYGDEPPGTPRVPAMGYATMLIDGRIAFDSVSQTLALVDASVTTLLQTPSARGTLIDEAALGAAIEPVLEAVVPAIVRRVLAAMPLPLSTPFPLSYDSPYTEWRIRPLFTDRSDPFQRMRGGLQAR